MKDFVTRSSFGLMDIIALLVGISFVVSSIAPRFEGRIFPVASGFTIDRVEPAGDGAVRIWGRFFINRPDCDFARLDWLLVGVSRNVSVPVVFEEGSKERSGGAVEFGPWLVQLTEAQLARSGVISYHQCPWRPWLTDTQLLP